MMGMESGVSGELRHFLEEYADDYYAARLLLFFADYPGVSFNRLAIIHSLDLKDSRLQICQALARLVKKGLLNSSADNNTTIYCLGGDDTTRRLVLQFSRLGRCQQAAVDAPLAVSGRSFPPLNHPYFSSALMTSSISGSSPIS